MAAQQVLITDDGDEEVRVHVGTTLVALIDHGTYGWDGMTTAIQAVTNVATALGAEVIDTQDIV